MFRKNKDKDKDKHSTGKITNTLQQNAKRVGIEQASIERKAIIKPVTEVIEPKEGNKPGIKELIKRDKEEGAQEQDRLRKRHSQVYKKSPIIISDEKKPDQEVEKKSGFKMGGK
jgi:hypothetical protein